MDADGLRERPINRAIVLDNETCVYCGTRLEGGQHTTEHVVGRRFVPKGSLQGQWNLIVRACKACNKKKADLEDDISAITMVLDGWCRQNTRDELLWKDAGRKASKSVSRKTRKVVAQSFERVNVRAPFQGGGVFTVTSTAPPQIDADRAFELARFHLTGFFYWITFNRETKTGGYWLGGFFPVMEALRLDWGNDVHVAFMNLVVAWEPRVLAATADGYFKVVIRRHPTDVLWSWAVEWNRSYRIVGFFGEQEAAERAGKDLPALELTSVIEAPNKWLRYRMEKQLDEANDSLFQWDELRLG